jgi:hypothetical protein
MLEEDDENLFCESIVQPATGLGNLCLEEIHKVFIF